MYFCFTQKHCLFIYMYCFLWPQVKTYLFQENKLVLKVMISLLGVKMITCLYKQRVMIYKCHYLLISQSKKKKSDAGGGRAEPHCLERSGCAPHAWRLLYHLARRRGERGTSTSGVRGFVCFKNWRLGKCGLHFGTLVFPEGAFAAVLQVEESLSVPWSSRESWSRAPCR